MAYREQENEAVEPNINMISILRRVSNQKSTNYTVGASKQGVSYVLAPGIHRSPHPTDENGVCVWKDRGHEIRKCLSRFFGGKKENYQFEYQIT